MKGNETKATGIWIDASVKEGHTEIGVGIETRTQVVKWDRREKPHNGTNGGRSENGE